MRQSQQPPESFAGNRVCRRDDGGHAARQLELELGDGESKTLTLALEGLVTMQAPPGTKLTLGLQGGTSVSIVLAPPS